MPLFRFSRELKNQEENTNGRQIFNSHEVSLQTGKLQIEVEGTKYKCNHLFV